MTCLARAGRPFNTVASMRRALESFQAAIEGQTFRAIVFDYDGTLSVSRRHDGSPPRRVIDHIKNAR